MNHCKKQAVNMDLQCILCTVNSSYAVKTPKDEVTCDTYWNFFKNLNFWRCFPQNRRFRDQTEGRKTTSQNGRVGIYGKCANILFLCTTKVTEKVSHFRISAVY